MKTIIIILCTVFITATALAADKLKDGLYTSNHGDVNILNSKSGNKTVGLYDQFGHILLSPTTITGRATVYTGAFSNYCKNGLVAFAMESSNNWNGNWKWKTTTGANNWDGSWNGDLKSSDKPLNDLSKTFETKLGLMDLVHNARGRVAGFLYTDNKKFYVYGNYLNGTFKGYISTDEESVICNTPFTIEFEWNEGIFGTATVPGFSKQTFRGARYKNLLEIELQTIKNYSNKGLFNNKEKGKVSIDMGLYDEK